jgi:hypothetical protein
MAHAFPRSLQNMDVLPAAHTDVFMAVRGNAWAIEAPRRQTPVAPTRCQRTQVA